MTAQLEIAPFLVREGLPTIQPKPKCRRASYARQRLVFDPEIV